MEEESLYTGSFCGNCNHVCCDALFYQASKDRGKKASHHVFIDNSFWIDNYVTRPIAYIIRGKIQTFIQI